MGGWGRYVYDGSVRGVGGAEAVWVRDRAEHRPSITHKVIPSHTHTCEHTGRLHEHDGYYVWDRLFMYYHRYHVSF